MDIRKVAGTVFIDHRRRVEIGSAVVFLGVLVVTTGDNDFETTLDRGTRADLYGSLAGTTAALLGFVLAALAILVALPSTERLDALRRHPMWPRVPSSYFRASRALLGALILCTFGIALDSDEAAWKLWELATAAALVVALVRVAAALVALDQILAVAKTPAPKPPIDDPGL